MPTLNAKAQTTAAPALAPQFDLPTFDLSNSQHLAMRMLMADVYARHANALERGLEQHAATYRGMGLGLERVAIYVLADNELCLLCLSLNFALDALLTASVIARAAA